MRAIRKWLSGCLCLALLLGVMPTAVWAEESAQPTGEEVLYTLSDETQVIEGDISKKVTRAQLAELIYANQMLKANIDMAGSGNDEPVFADITVPDTETNTEGGCTKEQRAAIIALYKAGYISGTTATTFSPDDEVSRGDGMLVIWMADGSRSNKEPMENPFADKSIKPHHLPVATCFYATGMISGQGGENGEGPTFGGDEKLSLYEAYVFIQRFDSNNESYQGFLKNTVSDSVTRAEMTEKFYNLFYQELSDCETTEAGKALYKAFIDLDSCTPGQEEAIQFFTERGIVNGTSGTTFTPNGPVSNLQLATLLQRCAGWPKTDPNKAQTARRAAISTLSNEADILDEAFQFLVENGVDKTSVQAAGNNQNAPALLNDLTSWSDSLQPEAPTISTEGGSTVITSQPLSVTITSATKGAVIYYTTDDSNPATSDTRQTYSDSISIAEPTTLKAIAVKNNLVSEAASATYTISAPDPEPEPEPEPKPEPEPDTGSSSSGDSGSSVPPVTTETTEHEDGSTTTTVTNNRTDTVTETTEYPDGSSEVVETRRDGTVTVTATGADGSRTETVERPDGSSQLTVEQADGTTASVVTTWYGQTEIQVALSGRAVDEAREAGEAVSLPIPAVPAAQRSLDAPAVEIDLPRGSGAVAVEIPAENVTPGTVAVLVNPDGTETVVKKSVAGGGAVTLTLESGAAVKLVNNGRTFDDVRADDWHHEAVEFVSARGIFSGTGGGSFSPDAAMTRGMLAVVLYNLEDSPDGRYEVSFADVPEDAWYADGIRWAAEQGVIGGYGGGLYGAEDPITREQLAVMLWRYAGSPDSSRSLSQFADAGEISGYARTAVAWASEQGIIGGYDGGLIVPQSSATRAQVAQMLMQLCRAQL